MQIRPKILCFLFGQSASKKANSKFMLKIRSTCFELCSSSCLFPLVLFIVFFPPPSLQRLLLGDVGPDHQLQRRRLALPEAHFLDGKPKKAINKTDSESHVETSIGMSRAIFISEFFARVVYISYKKKWGRGLHFQNFQNS